MQIQRFRNPYRNLVMKNYVSPHLFYFPGNVSSQGKTYLFSFLQDSSQIKKSNGVFLRRMITSAGLFQINIFTWNGTNILPEVALTCHSEWELSSDQEPKSHHEMTGIHGWKQKVPLFTQTGLNCWTSRFFQLILSLCQTLMKFGRKHWFTNPVWNLSLENTMHNNSRGRKMLKPTEVYRNFQQKKRKQREYELLRILSSKWDYVADLANLEYPTAERACRDTLHWTRLSALSNWNNILCVHPRSSQF